MGQKIHPSGFRVGITKKHQSQWFARFNKHKYSQTVLEDRMIRDTLNKLFPELLNPMGKGDAKRDQNARIKKSRITQIKIERNIVPYQIDIQIHAENCKLLKSSIKNLQVKREIIVKLQKTRYYLTNLKTKLDNLKNTQNEKHFQNSLDTDLKKTDRSNTKTARIKLLKKKLAKLKTSSTKISTKKVAKTKRSNLFSQVLKIKLLKAKLAKLLQTKPKRRSAVVSNTRDLLNATLKNDTLHENQQIDLADSPKITTKTLKSKKKVSLKRKFKIGSKLTKRQLKRQRVLKKRLRLRKFIRFRDRLLISKGLLIQKTGAKFTKKLLLTPTPKILKDSSLNPKVYLLPVQKIEKILASKKSTSSRTKLNSLVKKVSAERPANSNNEFLVLRQQSLQQKILQTSIFYTRQKKKLVNIYVEQMKKKFLPHLNQLFIQYTKKDQKTNNIFHLGYLKQWDFNRQAEYLKGQPVEKLNRFVQKLREKFIVKLNILRKEFIAFGSFSCNSADIVGLFQLYNFLMKLNDFVNDLKRDLKHKIKTRLAISKMNVNNGFARPRENYTETIIRSNKLRVIESSNTLLPQKVFRKKLENISNECRKIKFIEYLRDLVQKHRTENIFLYLASISESRQKLKEIKKEIKSNFEFYLPGMNSLKELLSSVSQPQATKINLLQNNNVNAQVTDQVNNILLKLAKKHPFDRTFSESKIEELERRKTMWVKNLQLIPKISIKFFSVNPKTLNQKASIVSESVVDALEKRKAFRKVIKSTKEKLMRNPEIKGVKIQVAGRLNGAEIARTEWVRAGRVPLQTLRANLDYSYRTANTIYGIIGVKVWIFKGFIKLLTK